MLVMSVSTLVGVGALVVVVSLILHFASSSRRAAKAEIDDEVQDKVKKAKALDTALAQHVLRGANLDAAIDEFQKARAGIHAIQADAPWMWDIDHLQKWAKEQLAIRAAAVNSKARLASLTVIVLTVLIVAAVDATLYNGLSTAQPMLSPQGPSQAGQLPAPLPSPTPASAQSNP